MSNGPAVSRTANRAQAAFLRDPQAGRTLPMSFLDSPSGIEYLRSMHIRDLVHRQCWSHKTDLSAIDWPGIRAAAVAIGVREAARQAGSNLPPDELVRFTERVMKRSSREGWLTAQAQLTIVPRGQTPSSDRSLYWSRFLSKLMLPWLTTVVTNQASASVEAAWKVAEKVATIGRRHASSPGCSSIS